MTELRAGGSACRALRSDMGDGIEEEDERDCLLGTARWLVASEGVTEDGVDFCVVGNVRLNEVAIRACNQIVMR